MQDEKAFIAELLNPETQNEAFRKLLQLYQKPLYNHVRNMVLSHDDTDDVLQNTFIKIYSNLKNFKGDSKLFSWIYRIATNEAISFLNSKKTKFFLPIGDVEGELSSQLSHDPLFSGDAIQRKLQQAVLKLPQQQRIIFNMKYFDHMKYDEISEVLGVTVGALKASYHHAVKKIEKYLTGN